MKNIKLDDIKPNLHEFETLPTGEEALVRYDRVPDIPNMYQGKVVFTKEEFILAYNRWIAEEQNTEFTTQFKIVEEL